MNAGGGLQIAVRFPQNCIYGSCQKFTVDLTAANLFPNNKGPHILVKARLYKHSKSQFKNKIEASEIKA